MNVMIGIDPHKASHTAVAIDGGEDQLSSVKVRATHRQVDQLMSWASPFVRPDPAPAYGAPPPIADGFEHSTALRP